MRSVLARAVTACVLLSSRCRAHVGARMRPHPAVLRARLYLTSTDDADAAAIVRAFEGNPSAETFATLCEAADAYLTSGCFAAAEACYRPMLTLDPHDAGVRERLAAALRSRGALLEAANELYTALADVESAEDRCWLYLDLGSLIEDIVPVPGVGAEWPKAAAEEESYAVRLRKGLEWSRERSASSSTFAVEVADEGECLSAEICYRRAIALQENNGEAHKRLADWLVMHPDGATVRADRWLFPRASCAIGPSRPLRRPFDVASRHDGGRTQPTLGSAVV